MATLDHNDRPRTAGIELVLFIFLHCDVTGNEKGDVHK